ncbi:MAG TPA: hypothetical protein PLU72_05805 [Candidatus Ozemobacteraceae bacterium]|nr:hypothetical protein [Candidatus Ozemobacteraceae bacterium]HQG29027.1 hypothetical protein [Candidatus Ozemobacteraceae bacterium]
MDDEQVTSPTPPEGGRKRKLTKRERELEREMMKTRMTPDDLAAAHRKFMMIMFGLFALVLVLMLVFNHHVEFMPDGGM